MTSELTVVTEPVRIAFPALYTPKPKSPDTPDKLTYQMVALLPEDYDLSPLHAAIKAAMIDKWGEVRKLPASKNPIKDCEEKAHVAGYEAGWHYINMHSIRQPAVVDQNGVPITDPDRVYAGCWVRVYTDAFAWAHTVGGQGVSFGLNAVQLVRDGERFDGRVNIDQAAAAFGTIEVPETQDASPSSDSGNDLFG